MGDLTTDECLILSVLAGNYYSEDNWLAFSFRALSRQTGGHLDQNRIRAACHGLAERGLARFERGLWTEDGEPAGSGYRATLTWKDSACHLAITQGEKTNG